MRSWLAVALVLVAGVTAIAYARLPANREYGIFDTNPPTPYSHYTPTGTSRGRILAVHGLDANRNTLNILSYALSSSGFEVFAIDLPGHGDSSAPFNALHARDVVQQVFDRLGPDTILLGHSFGGALLLEIADDRPVGSLVLFSPAPIPLEHVLADRVLVIDGQFDPAGIRAFVPVVRDATTGMFEYRELSWTGHSAGLLKPAVIRGVVEWLGAPTGEDYSALRLALIGIMLLAGIGAGIAFLGSAPATPVSKPPDHPVHVSVVYYTLAGFIAIAILRLINVTSWVRLFATDYVVGFFFLAGFLLLLRYHPRLHTSGRHLLISLAASAFVLAAIGWPVYEIGNVVISGSRWWRFPVLTALSLPLFLVDEVLLRPIASRVTAAGIAVVTRLVLGGIVATGVLILNREAGFLVLLIHMIIAFWIALWFGGELVRKRTDPLSAALFAAIVQAWMFSALFVTT